MLRFERRFKRGPHIRGLVIVIAALGFCRLPLGGAANPPSQDRQFRLPLRTEVQAFKGSDLWQAAQLECKFSTHQTAIVICDMWDNHWCSGAAERVGVLAHKMEPVLETCRAAGILIIHAPSDTMDVYKDYPQRRVMLLLPRVNPPASLGLTSPALPIDDTDRGCENPAEKEHIAWTRENSVLSIESNDVISDNGGEIYKLELDGKIVGKFGRAGKTPKEFGTVNAIDCRRENELYVGEVGNWRVQKVALR